MCQNGDPNPNIVMLLRDFVKFQVKRFAVEIVFFFSLFLLFEEGKILRRSGPSLSLYSSVMKDSALVKTTRVSYAETALSIMEISALFFSDTLFQVMFCSRAPTLSTFNSQ